MSQSSNDSSFTNSSSDDSTTAAPPPEGAGYPTWAVVIILTLCAFIVAGTILGNMLVCTAVSIVRKLRTPSNWLIVSLAVADLLVAILVMPLAATYEVMGRWVLDQAACDMWTSLDVLLCTASILNLCMISVDRYFVITKPFEYALKRTPARMALMILSVWVLSALISIPPLFGWKSPPKPGICELSQEISYQFYATIGAFYLPLTIMIIIYCRIYIVSSRIARKESKSKPVDRDSSIASSRRKSSAADTGSKGGSNSMSSRVPFDVSTPATAAPQYGRSGGVMTSRNSEAGQHKGSASSRQNSEDGASHSTVSLTARKSLSFLHRGGGATGGSPRVPSASKSERKATKTLGVIMGCFTACWLPFFILALIKPFLDNPASIPHSLGSILLWLGFANSFFNPIIYARFNREFRTPFKEILLGRCRGINVRLRSESYTEQYGENNRRGSSLGRPASGACLAYSASAVPEGVADNDGYLKPPLTPTPSAPAMGEDDVFDAPPSFTVACGMVESHNGEGRGGKTVSGARGGVDGERTGNNGVSDGPLIRVGDTKG